MPPTTQLLKNLYHAFNARNIDTALAALAEDVAWANGMAGGHVHGREAVRKYWTTQWASISPHVDPVKLTQQNDGSIAVDVHQIVHDLRGALLLDETVRHIFHIKASQISRFDIQTPGQLSSISHEPP